MLGISNNNVKHGKRDLTDNVKAALNKIINKLTLDRQEKRMSLTDRINQLFDEQKDKKNADLARFVGCSRATVTDWRNGKTKKIDGDNAYKVAEFFNVSPEWLQTGKGQKTKQKLYVNTESGPTILGKIPLISWDYVGEWGNTVNDYEEINILEWLPCPANYGPNSYALRIKGDSMMSSFPGAKSYAEGGIIFVDPDKPVSNGCRVVAKLPDSNDATFKEYREDAGRRFLKPLNPQYPIIEMTETTLICGVVIGYFVEE